MGSNARAGSSPALSTKNMIRKLLIIKVCGFFLELSETLFFDKIDRAGFIMQDIPVGDANLDVIDRNVDAVVVFRKMRPAAKTVEPEKVESVKILLTRNVIIQIAFRKVKLRIFALPYDVYLALKKRIPRRQLCDQTQFVCRSHRDIAFRKVSDVEVDRFLCAFCRQKRNGQGKQDKLSFHNRKNLAQKKAAKLAA